MDFDVHRGAMIGYVLFLAVAANPQGYRLELIGLPTLAVALAWCLPAVERTLRGVLRPQTAPPATS